jgi:hypothetical protein
MGRLIGRSAIVVWCVSAAVGCATQKESHTARTGVEQLLISSAIDQSLNKIDLTPLRQRKVFLETKYLDCVDKNYIIVSLHHRLLGLNAKFVDKVDDADVVLEVGSGGVGTDGEELFVGVPEIPLPPPSPVAIPKLGMFTRSKLNGTAKLLVLAYDAKTKAPIINGDSSLARSDQKTWNVLCTGKIQTGSVPEEIAKATGEVDFNVMSVVVQTKNAVVPSSEPTAQPSQIRTASHPEPATQPSPIRTVSHPEPAGQPSPIRTVSNPEPAAQPSPTRTVSSPEPVLAPLQIRVEAASEWSSGTTPPTRTTPPGQ